MRRKAEEERTAAARKAELKLELTRKESDARIAASAAAAAATATAAAAAPTHTPRRTGMEDDDIIGEVPPEVANISLCFAGPPQEEIVRIFHNTFKAMNLYRLRHMRGLRYEAFQDQERIGIEDRMLRLRKTSGTYIDFGKSFHEVWSEAFINYTAMLVSLFGKKAPSLYPVLTQFYGNILQFSKVYKWQEALLPMAIEVHMHIIAQQPSDTQKWVIPAEFQGRFCTPMTMIGMETLLGIDKRKRSRSPPSRRIHSSPGGLNNLLVVCDLFNKGSCTWKFFQQTHKRKACGVKEHGLSKCLKGKK